MQHEDYRPCITIIGVGAIGDAAVNSLTASAGKNIQLVKLAPECSMKQVLFGRHFHKPERLVIVTGLSNDQEAASSLEIAREAKKIGCLVVAVSVKPPIAEAETLKQTFEDNKHVLSQTADTLIVFPAESVLMMNTASIAKLVGLPPFLIGHSQEAVYGELCAFAVKILLESGQMTRLISMDWADLYAVLMQPGEAAIGAGIATGKSRAHHAATAAINSPLLGENSLENSAEYILLNITWGTGITLDEIAEIGDILYTAVPEDTLAFLADVHDETMGDALRVTIVAKFSVRTPGH